MQLTFHSPAQPVQIEAIFSDRVVISGESYSNSVLLNTQQVAGDWPYQTVADLDERAAKQLLALEPEIVILGTGASLSWPQADWRRHFVKAGIGCEIMDTAAACRTFSILAAEDRRVAAGLLL